MNNHINLDAIFKNPLWTISQGIHVAGLLEPLAIVNNFHVALGGSVLHQGWSDNDLDIIVYKRTGKGINEWHEQHFIETVSKVYGEVEYLGKNSKSANEDDKVKAVYSVLIENKRVDLIIIL